MKRLHLIANGLAIDDVTTVPTSVSVNQKKRRKSQVFVRNSFGLDFNDGWNAGIKQLEGLAPMLSRNFRRWDSSVTMS